MSRYWTYYLKMPSSQAQCNLCQKVIKTGGSTTNLRNHLRFKHKEYLDVLDDIVVDRDLSNNDSRIHDIRIPIIEENDDMIIEAPEDTAPRSRSISPARSDSTGADEDDAEDDDPASWEKGGSRDIKLTNCLVYMICIDNKPHVMVEMPGLRNFCRALQPLYRLPSGDEILEMIAVRYKAIKSKIVAELKEVEHVSLSCRKFMVKDRNFITVTAHFICPVKEKPRKLFLGVRWLEPFTTTVEEGSSAVQSILDDFELPSTKIVSVCHDTVDVLKMIVEQLFGEGKSVPCMAQVFKSILMDGFDDEGNLILKNLINEVDTAMKYVSKNYGSLVYRSLLSEAEAEDVVNVIEYMDGVTPKTVNSTYYIMHNFLRLQPCLLTALETGMFEDIPNALTNPNVDLLTEVIQILSFFDDATNELSASEYLTGSVIPPLICCMKTCLRDLPLSYSVTKEFRGALLQLLEARTQPYLMNPLLRRASFCDPRFKTKYVPLDGVVDRVIDECCAEMKDIVGKSDSTIEESENVTALWRAHDESIANQKKTDGQIPYEVQVYLEQMSLPRAADPFQFWMHSRGCIPGLSRIALKNLTVCGSSTSMDESEKVLMGIFSDETFCWTEEHIIERLFLNQLDKEYWNESSEVFEKN